MDHFTARNGNLKLISLAMAWAAPDIMILLLKNFPSLQLLPTMCVCKVSKLRVKTICTFLSMPIVQYLFLKKERKETKKQKRLFLPSQTCL